MTFDEILERAVWGAQRVSKLPPERLRVIAEAAFPQINDAVAERFAADEGKRSILRTVFALTFAGGTATLTATPLRQYIKDAKLSVAVVAGDPPLVFNYVDAVDYDRNGDPRLGKWKIEGLVVTAERPASVVLTGAASFSCIAAPAVPATPSTTYAGDGEMVPELIEALTNHLIGQDEDEA